MLVFILILVAIIGGEYFYITTLQNKQIAITAEKDKVSAMLVDSQANIQQLQSNISTQNSAILALKTEADARVAQHAIEIKKAQDLAISYQAKAAAILALQQPQNTTSCDAANELITQEITNAQK